MDKMISLGEFPYTCRACLSNDPYLELHSLENDDIRQLFIKCTSLEFSIEDDPLPLNICTECLEKCRAWFEFSILCGENHNILRKACLDTHDERSQNETVDQEIVIHLEHNDGHEESIHVEVTDCENILTANEDVTEETGINSIKSGSKFKRPAPTRSAKKSPHKRSYQPDLDESETVVPVGKNADGINTIKCQFCMTLFVDTNLFEEHVMGHSSETSFACKDCNHQFKTLFMFKNHMYIHSDFTFPCDICGLWCANFLIFHTHRSICEQCRCKDCGMVFRTPSRVRKHFLATHGNDNS